MMYQAWSQYLRGEAAEAERLADAAAKKAPAVADAAHLLGNAAAIHALSAYLKGEFSRTADCGREALGLLPPADRGTRGMVELILAGCNLMTGNLDDAERAVRVAVQTARECGNVYLSLSEIVY